MTNEEARAKRQEQSRKYALRLLAVVFMAGILVGEMIGCSAGYATGYKQGTQITIQQEKENPK